MRVVYTNNAAGAQTTGGSGSGIRVATTTTNGAVTSITLVSKEVMDIELGFNYYCGVIIMLNSR